MDLGHAYKDAKRVKQIASVLFKTGLGYYIKELGLGNHLNWCERNFKHEVPEDLPRRLRMALDQLGGSFVKLGQLLSLRPDLIPKEYCDEFVKLQDNVTSFSYADAKKIIEEELRDRLEHVFSQFEKEPIASASIGQVHKARLLNGKQVVVKVQRPNINEIMNSDIDLLYYLADLIQNYIGALKNYDLKGVVDEFKRYTLDELNYVHEGRNIDRFYKNFMNDPVVKIPKVFWDYTTKRILVMSCVEGISIDDKEGFHELGCKEEIVSNNLANCFLKQVFEYGFFHADPHPANVFILSGNKIALLDYGICGSLSEKNKEKLIEILVSLTKRDVKSVAEGFLSLGILEEENENLVSDLELVIEEYADANIEQIDIVKLFTELMEISRKYKFKLPVDLILLVKAIVTCESVGQQLDKKFNLSKVLHEYVDKLTVQRLKPSYLIKSFMEDVNKTKNNLKQIPNQINELLDKLKKGELGVQFDRKDLLQLEKEMDRSSNRISMGLIIGALIVASAIVLQVNNGRILAIIGFIIAIFLTINLLISVIRERRVFV